MKLPKLITRRRAKWTGLAITTCVAAAMIASYWYWPNVLIHRSKASFVWYFVVMPGGMRVYWLENQPPGNGKPLHVWDFDRRADERHVGKPNDYPIVWLPDLDTRARSRGGWLQASVPLWMPLALCALPTGILFYRDRKPKPGCCAKCRYDLTGLSGDTCPECGTKIATTDSCNPLTSTAEGENGVGLGENGVS